MFLLVVGAILVSLSAVTFGAVVLVRRGLTLMRAARESGRDLAEALERVSAAAERTAERAERVGDTARLDESLERLRGSRARLTVLSAAVDDVRAVTGRLTGAYPRK